ncbi:MULTISPECIES: immunity protein [unclassified Pseudomonas]|uniref:immunity protein n=1 Tax=unclassified Pseudomonas TaxID=196821 RepID=UPI000A1F2225|nr:MULTISPECIES: immunity protein [unclassified Pseudomonas]MDI2142003.1 immunity protein [Pseudomonas sp. ITA]
MSIIEQIVKNETVEDVLTVFALGSAIPSLDRMFGRYRYEVIENGELLKTYARLFEEGVLANGDGPIATKGPNWKAPDFMSNNKYA